MSDHTKKPRHRHSAVQLAALNALYDQTEHPSLAQRTELALALGLETKSVNTYFQNKRASLKKQPRGIYDHPSSTSRKTTTSCSSSTPPLYNPVPNEDDDDRDLHQVQLDHRQPVNQSQYIPDPNSAQHLSRAHVEELYQIRLRNPYPTSDESKMIADRLQVHHSTIKEWFRLQHHSSQDDHHAHLPPLSEAIPPSLRLPPITTLPPATSHPSLVGSESLRPISDDQYYPRQRSSSPRNKTPYGSSSMTNPQRRGRPDSIQLEGLRRLLFKTPNPTIEQRTALGREIGMDLVKVSNWFRNLRQSKAKRERRRLADIASGAASDDEAHSSYAGSVVGERVYLSSSTSPSRSETPPPSATSSSGTSSRSDDLQEARAAAERSRAWMRRLVHSSDEEEEAQEAVTPASSPTVPLMHDFAMPVDDKPTAVPYEDALLLLSFHQRATTF
ncbi:Pantothenate kinase [Mycena indigotica]|uniref:Pantothenate kinase n=1 Tax=Mycena indigotica TaxID=2126181 RepID=A0A8H6W8W8_9AGAR|nr:Pantothenate kinase [Mycena indigotica]KAF7307396.1 Pantothenate kinase [Mycena indigotica]